MEITKQFKPKRENILDESMQLYVMLCDLESMFEKQVSDDMYIAVLSTYFIDYCIRAGLKPQTFMAMMAMAFPERYKDRDKIDMMMETVEEIHRMAGRHVGEIKTAKNKTKTTKK